MTWNEDTKVRGDGFKEYVTLSCSINQFGLKWKLGVSRGSNAESRAKDVQYQNVYIQIQCIQVQVVT